MRWKEWDTVGDQSPYVSDIAAYLTTAVPKIRDLLSELYFKNFCNEVAQTFLPHFKDSIFRCKRISEMGSQQVSVLYVPLHITRIVLTI